MFSVAKLVGRCGVNFEGRPWSPVWSFLQSTTNCSSSSINSTLVGIVPGAVLDTTMVEAKGQSHNRTSTASMKSANSRCSPPVAACSPAVKVSYQHIRMYGAQWEVIPIDGTQATWRLTSDILRVLVTWYCRAWRSPKSPENMTVPPDFVQQLGDSTFCGVGREDGLDCPILFLLCLVGRRRETRVASLDTVP